MKLYVINLDRSRDRLEHIKAVFKQLDLPFIRVSAVDGQILAENDLAIHKQACKYYRGLTAGEIACYLSHIKAITLIANDDAPYGAIFEDDLTLSENAAIFLNESDWIPDSCDIVKLDTSNRHCHLGKIAKKLSLNYALAPLLSYHWSAAGYIVSKKAAQYIIKQHGLATLPFDEFLYNPKYDPMQKCTIMQMIPAIVRQTNLPSNLFHDIKKTKRLSIYRKIILEMFRMKNRYILPFWAKVITKSFFDKVPFQ